LFFPLKGQVEVRLSGDNLIKLFSPSSLTAGHNGLGLFCPWQVFRVSLIFSSKAGANQLPVSVDKWAA
jgi:hypothetical protein